MLLLTLRSFSRSTKFLHSFPACAKARFLLPSPNMEALKMRMSSMTPFARKHKVCVVGSGNWGSTIAKVVAENTAEHPEMFEKDVQMWVYEEQYNLPETSKLFEAGSEWSKGPQKLTELINHFHENVKYLPGIPLPHNVIANPSITDSVKDCTILIFNLPHQFIENLCKQLRGHILPYARGISCIKGVNVKESSISLFSETIGRELDIYCGALSGANIANEVALEKFSETTIAYNPPQMDSQNPTPATSRGPSPTGSQVDLTKLGHKDVSGKISKVKLKPLPAEYIPIDHVTWKTLFHRRYFHVRVVDDVAGVSLGGALKNIVAVAAGWVDGLGWGDNAKAAIMRVGLLEMVAFGKRFFKTVHTDTFTEESAGVADLITTCAGGRNHRCAKMSIQEGKPIEEIEARELNGQKLQGTLTAIEVNTFLKSQGLEKEFPLFTAVYNILKGNQKVQDLPDLLEDEKSKLLPSASQAATPAPLSDAQPLPQLKEHPPDQTTNQPPFHTKALLLPAPPLATSRYSRQVLIPQISLPGQTSLSAARILVIGLGGLGSPAALYLAGAGIHTLGLLDHDTVELSNLHRQIVHSEDSVRRGLSKVQSAVERLRSLNSEVEYVTYEERLVPTNALDIVGKYDVVLDCTDNPATRYLISDVCVLLGKPLISGAAQRTDGQLMVLNYPVGKGPCYRCVFPVPPPPETTRGCSEIGVLGTAVGTVGVLMAGEAVRVVVDRDKDDANGWRGTLLLYNAWPKDPKGMFRSVGLRPRRRDCVSCGEAETVQEEEGEEAHQQTKKKREKKITIDDFKPQIHSDGKTRTIDYDSFCGRIEEVHLLHQDERITADRFMNMMKKRQNRNPLIIDVREEIEFVLGPKLQGSINVPISRILRQRRGQGNVEGHMQVEADELEKLVEEFYAGKEGGADSVYFICQRGNDSQIAARRLIDAEAARGRNGTSTGAQRVEKGRWIGDVVGGFVELEKESGKEKVVSEQHPPSHEFQS